MLSTKEKILCLCIGIGITVIGIGVSYMMWKFIITDDDACHSIPTNTVTKYKIDLSKVIDPNSTKVSMVPEAMIEPTITEILKAPTEDVELGTFVRKFGSRIENNYRTLLNSIKEIGLNPTDYPRK